MIDRNGRNRLAELLRHLVSGQMRIFVFDCEALEIAEKSKDTAIGAVFASAFKHYGGAADLAPTRFRGFNRLSEKDKHRLAIAALFLYSDAEYEWPPSPGPKGAWVDFFLLLSCATCLFAGVAMSVLSFLFLSIWFPLGSSGAFGVAIALMGLSRSLAVKSQQQWEKEQGQFGDYDVWPFLRRIDFEKAKLSPSLLCGAER